MSFAITAVAIAAAGVGLSAYEASQSGKQAKKSQSKTQAQFPPAARELMQDVEFPLLRQNLQEQTGLVQQFAPGQDAFQQMFGRAPIQTALGAAEKGAKSTGLGDLGPVFENTFGLQPEFLETLKQLVLQRGAQTRAIVAPGYGSFLAPAGQSTTTQTAQGAPIETGFALAQSLGSLASTAHTAGYI